MMTSLHRLAALAGVAALLTACGTAPRTGIAAPAKGAMAAQSAALSLAAKALKDDPNDPTHQKMNAIVKDVLTGYYAQLLQTADTNHDGAVSRDEYAAGHSQDASWLFQATFDENRDGIITQAEWDKAMATDAPVDQYHHFTESQMEKAIAPYMADKQFTSAELRTYLVSDLGLHGDWPQIFKLLAKLDLNKDGKLLDAPGEGPAFMLTFARQQMEKALGLPVEDVDLN